MKNKGYIFLIFFLSAINLWCQSISIYSNISNSDSLDLGICHTTDSMETKLIIDNPTENHIYLVKENAPYYLFGATSNDLTGYFNYYAVNRPPYTINPKSQLESIIRFNGKDAPSHLEGKFHLSVQMRLSANQSAGDSLYQRVFIYTARRTDKYVGMYEKIIDFDSVLIGSNISKKLPVYYKNVWNFPIEVIQDTFKLISSKLTLDEFSIDKNNSSLPWTLTPKEVLEPTYISYTPLNRGRDTAMYQLIYYKKKHENPSDLSLDTNFAEARGIGVEEKLILTDVPGSKSFQNISKNEYNINLGDVQVGEEKEITLILENQGNLNYKKLDIILPNSQLSVSIKKDLTESIVSSKSDSLVITVKPTTYGTINRTLTLISDILKRKIYGANNSNTDIKFNILLNAIEPRIAVSLDSINFGEVIRTDSCPNTIPRIVNIKNIGNTDLVFSSIDFEPKEASFSYSNFKSTLAPLDEMNITINFSPSDATSYTANLVLSSNQSAPKDTVRIHLKGIGIEAPKIKLNLDSIRSMPGNKVQYAVKFPKEYSRLANNFKDILQYDKSLLSFDAFITDNTALDGLSVSALVQENSSGLELDLSRTGKQNFLENDTLFIIRFNTYLGNQISSSLIFNNPVFSNNICKSIYTPVLSKGYFIIDSVCGLDLKVKSLPNSQFAIQNLFYATNSRSLICSINAAFSTHGELSLFDYCGNPVNVKSIEKLEKGTQRIILENLNLIKGVYFLTFKAGIYSEVQSFSITE